jgi:hypothetical protein
VQNTFARIVTGANKSDNIKPIHARLHWLPIASRIDFRIALLTFKAVTRTSKQPDYVSELVYFNIPTRQLRSSSRNLLQASACKTVFATRAFFHAAPAIWNKLPCELTNDISSVNVFKRRLKTHFLHFRD